MKYIPISALLLTVLALWTGCNGKADQFQLSVDESIQALLFSDEVVVPDEIMEAVQKPGSNAVLVDVRSPAEFEKGHLENAINIPTQHVLEPENIKLWDQGEVTYYLYGQTQLEANSAWMILRQLGYTNVRILQGGLSYFADFSDSSWLKLEDETARFNYAEVFRQAIENAEKINAPAPKPVIVQEKPKEIVPQKRQKISPQPVEEEEEEGC
jgi:rhodanese-related sulfurtransferase